MHKINRESSSPILGLDVRAPCWPTNYLLPITKYLFVPGFALLLRTSTWGWPPFALYEGDVRRTKRNQQAQALALCDVTRVCTHLI